MKLRTLRNCILCVARKSNINYEDHDIIGKEATFVSSYT